MEDHNKNDAVRIHSRSRSRSRSRSITPPPYNRKEYRSRSRSPSLHFNNGRTLSPNDFYRRKEYRSRSRSPPHRIRPRSPSPLPPRRRLSRSPPRRPIGAPYGRREEYYSRRDHEYNRREDYNGGVGGRRGGEDEFHHTPNRGRIEHYQHHHIKRDEYRGNINRSPIRGGEYRSRSPIDIGRHSRSRSRSRSPPIQRRRSPHRRSRSRSPIYNKYKQSNDSDYDLNYDYDDYYQDGKREATNDNLIKLRDDCISPIRIDRLSLNTTKDHILEIFGLFGNILDVNFLNDTEINQPLGVALIYFKNKMDRDTAKRYMDGAFIDGQTISVKYSRRPGKKFKPTHVPLRR